MRGSGRRSSLTPGRYVSTKSAPEQAVRHIDDMILSVDSIWRGYLYWLLFGAFGGFVDVDQGFSGDENVRKK